MKKRIIVGATGASGLPLLVKCLEIIREDPDFESYLIMSSSAELTLRQETELEVDDVHRRKSGQNRPVVLLKQKGC